MALAHSILFHITVSGKNPDSKRLSLDSRSSGLGSSPGQGTGFRSRSRHFTLTVPLWVYCKRIPKSGYTVNVYQNSGYTVKVHPNSRYTLTVSLSFLQRNILLHCKFATGIATFTEPLLRCKLQEEMPPVTSNLALNCVLLKNTKLK